MNNTMPYSPYGAPTSNPTTTSPNTQVSEVAVDMLRRTKGWVRFLSILGFILAALMIMGGLAVVAAGSRMGPGLGAGVGIVYIIFSILYIYPCIKLWQYGTSIANLMTSRSSIDLETALDKQRGFWKFVGVMAIIVISIYVLIFLFAFIIGISNAI